MATRQHTQAQKEAMKAHLRSAIASGTLRRGDPAPSNRMLMERFGLSQGLISQTLQELVDEGVLHTIPRAGTFIGQAKPRERPTFALLIGDDPSPKDRARTSHLRLGFEDRIALLGGTALCFGHDDTLRLLEGGVFPKCAGAFEIGVRLDDVAAQHPDWPLPSVQAFVCFGMREREHPGRDTVSFDDLEGAREATEHLLSLGHERIAFAGLHLPSLPIPKWSALREQGWRAALVQSGVSGESLFFGASSRWDIAYDDAAVEPETARNFVDAFCACSLAERPTALVAANDSVAMGVLEGLRARGLARDEWPAVVGFDNDAEASDALLTSLRVPWDSLGRTAADLLWERSTGRLPAGEVHRAVPLRLIPRLSCRADWTPATWPALS